MAAPLSLALMGMGAQSEIRVGLSSSPSCRSYSVE